MTLRRAAPLLCLLLAVSLARAAGENDASGDGLAVVADRQGDLLTVANGFDGSAGFVRMTSTDRNRNVLWDSTHSDGYLERAAYTFMDPSGNVIVAGVRLVQGVNYMWVMKYSAAGQLQWEQVDSTPGCAAFNVAGNDAGDVWVAGSCQADRSFSVRLLRLAANGGQYWTRDYSEAGRDYVRNLSVDFADRANLTLEIVSGGQRGARGIVYDGNGNRLASY
jgi:hypothetical protein